MNSKNLKRNWTKKSSLIQRPLVFFAFLFVFFPASAFAEARIDTFVAHIEIQNDGSALVQEEIVFDFGDTPQHGIFREIPLMFPSVGVKAEISGISVSDGQGTPRQTSYEKGGNMITLKIGDKDVFVLGKQLYVIRYTLWGATEPTLLKDKFYWDITGHAWKTPIDRIRADIVLPTPISVDAFSYSCYSGDEGSKTPCTSASIFPYATSGVAQTIRFEQEGLSRNQGLVVAVDLPRGTIFYAPGNRGPVPMRMSDQHIVKWWKHPFIDASLALPFFVFAGLYSILLSQKDSVRRKKLVDGKGKKEGDLFTFTTRRTYVLAGSFIAVLSVFVPMWNFGIFLSGIIIFVFAWFYPSHS